MEEIINEYYIFLICHLEHHEEAELVRRDTQWKEAFPFMHITKRNNNLFSSEVCKRDLISVFCSFLHK